MCGIAGKIYFNEAKQVSEAEIKGMTQSITHRGPDDEGIYLNRNIGLGHRRLSIIDLSPQGHQPMSDNTGNLTIIFNGEIYNFQKLRKSLEQDGVKFKSNTDTEVIIYLYKKYGVDCLKYLEGMFAFAIWDDIKKEMFLATDRVGKKPLKYYFDKDCFIFSSELKAILRNREVKKALDYQAIDEYLSFQYVPHPRTGFKNIWKLPPATYLVISKDGVIKQEKYWHLNFFEKLELSETEWEQKITDQLRESVRLRLISDVPLGAHLSGGIDSSMIVALMSEFTTNKIKTFSIGFNEKDYNELPYAKKVAEKFKTEHHEFIVSPNAMEILPELVYHYEEPFADSSALPTWYLSKLTREYVTVALNGDGGDENFAGYPRYDVRQIFNRFKNIPFKKQFKKMSGSLYDLTKLKIFKRGRNFFNNFEAGELGFYFNLLNTFGQYTKKEIYSDKLKEQLKSADWDSSLKDIAEEAGNFNWLDQKLYIDINSYLPDDLLVKVDTASMAHALEVRSPFLDFKFLELTAKMPSSLKFNGQDKKYILKKIAYKYLPRECVDRPKQGFGVPLEHWFGGELHTLIERELLDKKFMEFGLFKENKIRLMIEESKTKKENNTNKLWSLLMLNEWLKRYF